MRILGKLVVMVLMLIISSFSILFLYRMIDGVLIDSYLAFIYFPGGVLLYLISTLIIKPKKYKFWNTLRHELLHAIFAILTFSEPYKLVATKDGDEDNRLGVVFRRDRGGRFPTFIRQHLVALAPYFIPLVTLLLCGLFLVIKPEKAGMIGSIFISDYSIIGLLSIIGVVYGYELYTTLSQAGPHQTDFNYVGYRYGKLFVYLSQIIFFSIIIYILAIDFDSTEVLVESYNFTIEYIGELIG